MASEPAGALIICVGKVVSGGVGGELGEGRDGVAARAVYGFRLRSVRCRRVVDVKGERARVLFPALA
jgi:hypothetical protein